MSEPFIGEIRIFSFNFAPQGWSQCNGQLLPITQNQALGALLGTQYGGDGKTTFQLPDLRGRVPVAAGRSENTVYNQGATGGTETVTLTVPQMPPHIHNVNVVSNTVANTNPPGGNYYAKVGPATLDLVSQNFYAPFANPIALDSTTLSTVGGSGAHSNMQPYLVVNYCIALVGNWPSRD